MMKSTLTAVQMSPSAVKEDSTSKHLRRIVSSITFTPENWRIPQTIYAEALDNTQVEQVLRTSPKWTIDELSPVSSLSSIIRHSIHTNDTSFAHADPGNITYHRFDNDFELKWSDARAWTGLQTSALNPLNVRDPADLKEVLAAQAWANAVPSAWDSVWIPSWRSIILDVSPPPLTRLVVEGRLIFGENVGDLELRAMNIEIRGGSVEVGSAARPFRNRAVITLEGDKAVPPVSLGSWKVGARSLIVGGKLSLWGLPRRLGWTTLNTTALANTSLLVVDGAVDWVAGDELALAPTDYDPHEAEVVTVLSVVKNTSFPSGGVVSHVALNSSLRHSHYAGIERHGVRSMTMKGAVGLLSRNVVIRAGRDARFNNASAEQYGAVVRARKYSELVWACTQANGCQKDLRQFEGQVQLANVECRHCGQLGESAALELHGLVSAAIPRSLVANGSFYTGFGVAMDVTGSKGVSVTGTVSYRSLGAAFQVGLGSTDTVVKGNLAILGVEPSTFTGQAAPAVGPEVFGLFSDAGMSTIMQQNMAAGSERAGFWGGLETCPDASVLAKKAMDAAANKSVAVDAAKKAATEAVSKKSVADASAKISAGANVTWANATGAAAKASALANKTGGNKTDVAVKRAHAEVAFKNASRAATKAAVDKAKSAKAVAAKTAADKVATDASFKAVAMAAAHYKATVADDLNIRQRDNTACSSLFGFKLRGDVAQGGCRQLKSPQAWKCLNFGIFGHVNVGETVRILNARVADSKTAILVNVIGPSSVDHRRVDKRLELLDSLVVGRSAAGVGCSSTTKPGGSMCAQRGVRCEVVRGAHLGVIVPSFRSDAGRGPLLGGWGDTDSSPAIGGLTAITNVTFAKFGVACGDTKLRDYTIATNEAAQDVQHPVRVQGIEMFAIASESKVLLHRPRPAWVSEADCGSMDCDGLKHVLIEDIDGSWLGLRGGSVVSQVDFVSSAATLHTALPSSMATAGRVADLRGLYHPGCFFDNLVQNGFTCYPRAPTYRMLVTESLDADHMSRAVSPLGVWSRGYVYLLSGNADHSLCLDRSCSRRQMSFWGLAALNETHEMYYDSSPPQSTRLHLLNTAEGESIRAGLHYPDPQRYLVFVNGKNIEDVNMFRGKWKTDLARSGLWPGNNGTVVVDAAKEAAKEVVRKRTKADASAKVSAGANVTRANATKMAAKAAADLNKYNGTVAVAAAKEAAKEVVSKRTQADASAKVSARANVTRANATKAAAKAVAKARADMNMTGWNKTGNETGKKTNAVLHKEASVDAAFKAAANATIKAAEDKAAFALAEAVKVAADQVVATGNKTDVAIKTANADSAFKAAADAATKAAFDEAAYNKAVVDKNAADKAVVDESRRWVNEDVLVGAPHGSHAFDRTTGKLFVVLNGDAAVTIITAPVVKISMVFNAAPAIFYAARDSVVKRLAAALGIDSGRVAVADVQEGQPGATLTGGRRLRELQSVSSTAIVSFEVESLAVLQIANKVGAVVREDQGLVNVTVSRGVNLFSNISVTISIETASGASSDNVVETHFATSARSTTISIKSGESTATAQVAIRPVAGYVAGERTFVARLKTCVGCTIGKAAHWVVGVQEVHLPNPNAPEQAGPATASDMPVSWGSIPEWNAPVGYNPVSWDVEHRTVTGVHADGSVNTAGSWKSMLNVSSLLTATKSGLATYSRVQFRVRARNRAGTSGWSAGSAVLQTASKCGDSKRHAGEDCDDGNVVVGDGCDAGCTVEVGYACGGGGVGSKDTCAVGCGNGARGGMDGCDDGNTISGDGCSASCRVEAGYVCTGNTPDRCVAVCGDGTKARKEACDDGNTAGGDGCSAACSIEAGFTCAISAAGKSVCHKCGNGRIEGAEMCDDGGLSGGCLEVTCAGPTAGFVCATVVDGGSGVSSSVCTGGPATVGTVGIATGSDAIVDQDSVTWAWGAPSGYGTTVTKYELQVRLVAPDRQQFLGAWYTPPGGDAVASTLFQSRGLVANSLYVARARGYNGAGWGQWNANASKLLHTSISLPGKLATLPRDTSVYASTAVGVSSPFVVSLGIRANTSRANEGLVTVWDVGSNKGWKLNFQADAKTIQFEVAKSGSGSRTAVHPTVVTDGGLHKVSAVYTGTSIYVVVDGVAGPVYTLLLGEAMTPSAAKNILVGNDACCSARGFSGEISDVIIGTLMAKPAVTLDLAAAAVVAAKRSAATELGLLADGLNLKIASIDFGLPVTNVRIDAPPSEPNQPLPVGPENATAYAAVSTSGAGAVGAIIAATKTPNKTTTTVDTPAVTQTQGTFSMQSASVEVVENVTNAVVTVMRVGGSMGACSIPIYSVDGVSNATASVDYMALNGTVVFKSGQTEGNVSIRILDDTVLEVGNNSRTEMFDVKLGKPRCGAPLGSLHTTTVHIEDDELPPIVAFAPNNVTTFVLEGGVAVLTVMRTGAVNTRVELTYEVVEGTAKAALGDFTVVGGSTGSVVFESGVTSQLIKVVAATDHAVHGDANENKLDTLRVYLRSVQGAMFAEARTSTISIEDTTVPGLVMSRGAVVVGEGGRNASYAVMLNTQPRLPSGKGGNPVVTLHVRAPSGHCLNAAGAPNFALQCSADADCTSWSANGRCKLGTKVSVHPLKLTYNESTWNVSQSVKVWAFDDSVHEPAVHHAELTHWLESADPRLNSTSRCQTLALSPCRPFPRRVNITENDKAAVRISWKGAGLNVKEANGISSNASYSVTLLSEPWSTVIVRIRESSNSTAPRMDGIVRLHIDQLLTSTRVLSFHPSNWSVPRVVRVSAVDDRVEEDRVHSALLSHTVESSDLDYHHIVAKPVPVNITDNTERGVRVSTVALNLTEGGTAVNYAISLAVEPNVTLAIGKTEVVKVVLSATSGHCLLGSMRQPNYARACSTDSECGTGNRCKASKITAVPAVLTFHGNDWHVPQIVTVTAIDDHLAEPDPHQAEVTHVSSSEDRRYHARAINKVAVRIFENDVVGLKLSGKLLHVSESGQTDTYGVSLKTEPWTDVDVIVHRGKQLNTSVKSLRFTPVSWNTTQNVTVSAIDDHLDEGIAHDAEITHSALSTDSTYRFGASDDTRVMARVTDNNAAGISILRDVMNRSLDQHGGPLSLTVAEGPATQKNVSASYFIVLNSKPMGPSDAATDVRIVMHTRQGHCLEGVVRRPNVTLACNTDADCGVNSVCKTQTKVSIEPRELIFNSTHWHHPRRVVVRAYRDTVVEPHVHHAAITHSASSDDARYNLSGSVAEPIRGIAVKIYDNNVAELILSHAALSVSESGGGQVIYTVRLRAEPWANVTVNITHDGQLNVAPALLHFSPARWGDIKSIVVQAVDDRLQEALVHTSSVAYTVASPDTVYNNLVTASTVVNIADDDRAALVISKHTVMVSEGGYNASYFLSLDAMPLLPGSATFAPVTVRLSPQASHCVSIKDGSTLTNRSCTEADAGAGKVDSCPERYLCRAGPGATVHPREVIFTKGNWTRVHMITISAVDDTHDEPHVHYTQIAHESVSADVRYDTAKAMPTQPVVNVSIVDNDHAAIMLSSKVVDVTEGGASGSYEIWLATAPRAAVTINISTAKSAATTSVSALHFTVGNWKTRQVVSVIATDDDTAEISPFLSNISHAVISEDPTYDKFAVVVTARIYDLDRGIVNASTSRLGVKEGGAVANITLKLNRAPNSSVHVYLSSNANQLLVEPTVLVFEPGTFRVDQLVKVSAVDDRNDEDDFTAFNITYRVSSSDLLYDGVRVHPCTVTVEDNDEAGVHVMPLAKPVALKEGGAGYTYEITLASQPVREPALSGPSAEGAVIVSMSVPVGHCRIQAKSPTGIALVSVMANYTLPCDSATDCPAGSACLPGMRLKMQPDTLTFSVNNWSSPQRVVVSAVEDALDQPETQVLVISHHASSSDPKYNSSGDYCAEYAKTAPFKCVRRGRLSVPSLDINVTDNDESLLVTSTSSITLTEGSERVYWLKLASKPFANVTIDLNHTQPSQPAAGPGIVRRDFDQIQTSPAVVVFTPANFNEAQYVRVKAIEDLMEEKSPHNASINLRVTSLDTSYNALTSSPVDVKIIDNDKPGVYVSTATLHVSEGSGGADGGGGIKSYMVGLLTEPKGVVNISVHVKNGYCLSGPDNILPNMSMPCATDADCKAGSKCLRKTKVSVTPKVLVFGGKNWWVNQAVNVSAFQDSLDEPSLHRALVTHSSTSIDPKYNSSARYCVDRHNKTASGCIRYATVNILNVQISIDDDDTSAIRLSTKKLSISELGGVAGVYLVSLASRPNANVTVHLASTPAGQVKLSLNSLTFTSDTWKTGQQVRVTAVDDVLVEARPHTVLVTHKGVSADPLYNLTATKLLVAVDDDDFPGVLVSPTFVRVAEGSSAAAVYGLRLNTAPALMPGNESWVHVSVRVPFGHCVVADTQQPRFNTSCWQDADCGSNSRCIKGSKVIATPSTVKFNWSNFDKVQNVTVTAVDDRFDEGPWPHRAKIVHFSHSVDPRYNGTAMNCSFDVLQNETICTGKLQLDAVQVEVADNDVSGLVIMNKNVYVTEGGRVGSFAVYLASQPSNIVEVEMSVLRQVSEFQNALAPAVVCDHDTAAAACWKVGLKNSSWVASTPGAAQPRGAGSADPAVLSRRRVVFSPANWSVPYHINVTAVDDNIDNPTSRMSGVRWKVRSKDTFYGAVVPDVNPIILIANDDHAGITISPPGERGHILDLAGLVAEEGGEGATYGLSLATQPLEPVYIDIDTPSVAISEKRYNACAGVHTTVNKTVQQVSIHPRRVVFTAANWSRPATIYVAGLADEINEGGTHVAKLLHVARSKDENYDSSTSLLRSRSCNQSLTMALAEGRSNRTAHPDFVALMAAATQLKRAPGTTLAQLCLNVSAHGKEAPTRLCCPQITAPIVDVQVTEEKYVPAPLLTNATLTETGTDIDVTFGQSTDRARLFGTFACSLLLTGTTSAASPCSPSGAGVIADVVTAFGRSSCRWISDRAVRVSLGPGATVKAGDWLQLRPGQVRTLGSSFYTSIGAIQLTSSVNLAPPSAILRGPATIGRCQKLVSLDASLSSGAGVGALRFYYSVKAAAGDTSLANITMALNATNNVAAHGHLGVEGQSSVAVPGALLRPGTTYVFSVTVRSPLNPAISATATHAVTRATSPAPSIEILGDPVRTVEASRGTVLSAVATHETCASAGKTAVSSATKVNFFWLQIGTAPPLVPASSKQQGTMWYNGAARTLLSVAGNRTVAPGLKLSPGQMRPGLTYEFVLIGALASDAASNSSARTSVQALAAPLRVVLPNQGGLRVVGASNALVLDASSSYDPDNTTEPEKYTWTCAILASQNSTLHGSACRDYAGKVLVLPLAGKITVANGTLPANTTMMFTTHYAKGTRNASAAVSIRVEGGTLPEVDIKAPSCKSCRSAGSLSVRVRVNPTDELILSGSAQSSAGGGIGYRWSQTNGDIDPREFGSSAPGLVFGTPLTQSTLLINAGGLSPGGEYTFRLTGTDRWGSAYAEMALVVNSVPTSGTVSVLPAEGVAFQTNFKVLAARWTDDKEDLPLKFRFSCRPAPGQPEMMLTSVYGLSNEVSSMLPVGRSPDYVVVVTASIKDNLGAATSSSVQTKVTKMEAAATGNVTEQLLSQASILVDSDPSTAMTLATIMAGTLNAETSTGKNTTASELTARIDLRELLLDAVFAGIGAAANDAHDDTETAAIAEQQLGALENVMSSPAEVSPSMALKALSAVGTALGAAESIGADSSTAAAAPTKKAAGSFAAVLSSAMASILPSPATAALNHTDTAEDHATRAKIRDQAALALTSLGHSLMRNKVAGAFATVIESPNLKAAFSVVDTAPAEALNGTNTGAAASLSFSVSKNTSAVSGAEEPQFAVPTSVFRGLKSEAGGAVHVEMSSWSLNIYSDADATTTMTSSVVGMKVASSSGKTIKIRKLSTPIGITIPSRGAPRAGYFSQCRFWNASLGVAGGWSTSGCETVADTMGDGAVRCLCDHLTDFGLVLQSIDGFNTTDVSSNVTKLIESLGAIAVHVSDTQLATLLRSNTSDAIVLGALRNVFAQISPDDVATTAARAAALDTRLAVAISTEVVALNPESSVELAVAMTNSSVLSVADATLVVKNIVNQLRAGSVATSRTPGAVMIAVAKANPARFHAPMLQVVQSLATETKSTVMGASGGTMSVAGGSVTLTIPGAAANGKTVDIGLYDCSLVSTTIATGSCVRVSPHSFDVPLTLLMDAPSGATHCMKSTDELSDDYVVAPCQIQSGKAMVMSSTFSVYTVMQDQSGTRRTDLVAPQGPISFSRNPVTDELERKAPNAAATVVATRESGPPVLGLALSGGSMLYWTSGSSVWRRSLVTTTGSETPAEAIVTGVLTVYIRGHNFGSSLADIKSVTMYGTPCGSLYYHNSTALSCVTCHPQVIAAFANATARTGVVPADFTVVMANGGSSMAIPLQNSAVRLSEGYAGPILTSVGYLQERFLPHAIALDTQYVYFANAGNRRIYRTTLDGRSVVVVASDIDRVYGLALDGRGSILFSDSNRGALCRVSTAPSKANSASVGSPIVDIVGSLRTPRGLALDMEAGHIYFTEETGRIYRVGLDGANLQLLVQRPSNVRLDGIVLKLDGKLTQRRICWTETNSNLVRCSTLLGSRLQTVAGEDGSITWPRSLILTTRSELMWAEYLGRIKKANATKNAAVESVFTMVGEPSKIVETEIEVYERLGSSQLYFMAVRDTFPNPE